ncbi:hypothetical protein OPT61_g3554 [Boeremia exigua]|uniref:Uncharacterized protein n=1 Tax=Boeremia exigua TaxID=749465 RepID=A0ACC2IHG7_9PLEO|nr:hypothetical protein OPT61_g3554 [Boeremia exigua]
MFWHDCPVSALVDIATLPPIVVDPVIFQHNQNELYHAVTGHLIGKADEHTGEILKRVLADSELVSQLTLRKDALVPNNEMKAKRSLVGYLSITIYGPRAYLSSVGDFMTQCGRNLEDPVGCDRNVPYLNPQCLFSLHENPPMTFDLSQSCHEELEDTTHYSDILAGFETTDTLFETRTPDLLRTSLKPHQQRALTFFLKREEGRHPFEDGFGLWLNQADGCRFKNIITNERRPNPGPAWRGGLLADEMGLGKTLSMIALIASDHTHIVRNQNTSTAKAVAALKARARWAISGTPVQNRLTDFLGLFKFLHFFPYDNPEIFDNEISQLWRDKPIEEATETFKKLLSSVMIRRTKAILDLPVRTDKVLRVSFDADENEYYRSVEQPVVEALDQYPETSWPNTIQRINKLRLICNLGLHMNQVSNLEQATSLNDSVQSTIAVRLSLGEDWCAQCLGSVSLPSTDDTMGVTTSSNTYYSTCCSIYCAACAQLLGFRSPSPCGCTSEPTACHLLPLPSSVRTNRSTPTRDGSPAQSYGVDGVSLSSKVRALIQQIKACPVEKNVVFSFWTTSLDMVERGLSAERIGFVRIDGSVAAKNRVVAVEQLRSNPNISVILLTIACGACGLDLTAASRVHLLEPQWNPSLDDQALARAHRLGQTRPVTTFKYIMRNSFEEDILQLQDRKKHLATTILADSTAMKTLQTLLQEKRNQAKEEQKSAG